MFIVQQRKSAICLTVLLIVLLEFTFVEKSISNQKTCGGRNTGTTSYFIVDREEVNWTEAWRICNNNRSTLPVICSKHEQDDLTKFLKTNIGSSAVWTSGIMNKFNEWKWVDGRPLKRGDFIPQSHESYTHAALNRDQNFTALNPSHGEVYLCQYSGSSCNSQNVIHVTNGCVEPSGDNRTWYDARNQCVKNGGDLAILNGNDSVTLRGKGNKLNAAWSYWIGLRKNAWHWTWQGTVPSDGSGEDVKYSNWSNDPHSSSGEYISIEASNGDWKAARSTDRKKVVCQASSDETTSSTSSTLTTSRPTIASKSSNTTSRPSISSKLSSTTNRLTVSSKSSNTTNRLTVSSKSSRRSGPSISRRSSSATSTMSITLLSTRTNAMSSMSEGAVQSTTDVDWRVLLYSGVGAGIAIIIICIIVIILAIRCRRKPQKDNNGSNVKNNSEQNRLDLSPNKPATSPTNAPAIAPVTGADDTQGVYAEISLATLNQMEDGAKAQQPGIIYAALEFQKEPTYLEPDKKRVNTTDAAKVGPMGDVIYAMPESKGHAATSPGNESASHPSKVTTQGDVYALPVKNSKSPNANPSHGGIYENL